ncbi:MAG: alpha/beta fold hydrolase [Erysipelotrichaceae bacterium]
MKHYPVQTLQLKNGETVAYRQAGTQGDLVVLVHGNMSSSVHFQTTMERLENDHRVYAVDLRGFGDSSYKNELNSLRDFAVDVELWIEALDLKDFNLLGWSTGGGIVLEIAADMPERVKKLFLLDSVGLKGYPMFRKDEKYQPVLTDLLKTKEDIAKDPVQVLPILAAYANKDKGLLKAIWNAVIYNLNQPNEEDYDHYLDAMLKQRNLVDVDYSLVMFNFTHEASAVTEGSGRIDLIKCPLIIMHGVKDYVVPYAMSVEMKQFFGDRAKLVTFENAGHSVITDDLDLFIQTLKENF